MKIPAKRFPYPDIKSLCQFNKSDQAELKVFEDSIKV